MPIGTITLVGVLPNYHRLEIYSRQSHDSLNKRAMAIVVCQRKRDLDRFTYWPSLALLL